MTQERSDDLEFRTDSDFDDTSLSDEELAETAEIRAEIEETRDEMGGTLQELGDRLEPGHLVQQAKDNVREATIGRVEETAKGMSDMVIETIKRNPIPAALAGAGLALLWKNRSNGHDSGYQAGQYRAYGDGSGQVSRPGPGMGEKVGDTVGKVGETVGQTFGTVTDTAGQAVGNVAQGAGQAVEEVGFRFERFMEANPLAMGAIAIGAGAVVGSILPETQQEREFLGDASRQVAETVRQTVDQVADKAEQTLDETEQQVATTSR